MARKKQPPFRLYKHASYESYRRKQCQANRESLHKVWAIEENVAFLAKHIEQLQPVFGLCHGTRQGKEQQWFRKYLPGCEVLGTEIAPTAGQFPFTIQWDFHEVKPEWLGAADFVYSNAFDHSYDPEKCLQAWMSCVRPGGVCLIEHDSTDELSRARDPFAAPIECMPYLVLRWGRGAYVREILDLPVVGQYRSYQKCLVIEQQGNR